MFIVLNPTWRCDLADEVGKCPYCPNLVTEDGHKVEFYWGLGENRVGEEAKTEDWLNFFGRLKPSFVDICGGEPLYWGGLRALVKGLPKGFTWGITSNCFQPEVIENLNLGRCEVWTASFHPYAVGRGGYLDKFFSCLRILTERRQRVVVSIMGYPGNLHWLPFWVEAFEGWGFEVVVQPYENPLYDWNEHPEKMLALLELRKNMSREKLPIWDLTPSKKICAGGMDYLMTSPDGSVYRCNMALVTGSKPLGTIYDSNLPILREPTVCELPCSSSCDRERRERGEEMGGDVRERVRV